MSGLFEVAAALTRPALPKPEPTLRDRAMVKARVILAEHPDMTPQELVALGWLEGRLELCDELRTPKEYDCICQRCGRRDGSRFSLTPPRHGFFETVCFHCSAGDEPRAA